MDPLQAWAVARSKRTSSVPGRLTRPANVRSIPPALEAAVHAPREKFARYGGPVGMSASTKVPVDSTRAAAQTENTIMVGNGNNAQEKKQHKVQHNEKGQKPKLLPTEQTKQPSLPKTSASSSSPKANGAARLIETSLVGLGDKNASTCADANTGASSTPTPTTTTITTAPEPPKVRLTAMLICIPYDPIETPEAMKRLRRVVEYCPDKVARFLRRLHEIVATTVIELPPAPPGIASRLKTSSSAHQPPRQLEALSKLWEDRRDVPVSVSSTLGRRRGLFGDAERKELHHLVISVLNRVTNDAEKYREVKNELLRLPIPEANDAMLEKIVEVFFIKAVREQHFSSLYAELVSALCKVPEGQRIVGDKEQSLEYRLRQQLLHRCQMEFRQLEEENIEHSERGGEDRATQSAEELFKERRDRVCGIVQFVGELFLRHIVTDLVIMDILTTACTGPWGREGLRIPPPYTPTESQMDEIITLLDTVDSVFFRTPLGSHLLPDYTKVMQHWCASHPVSRIRFLLLSVVERLQKLLDERNATISAAAASQQQHSVHDGKRALSSSMVLRPLSPCSEESSFTSTGGRVPTAFSNDMSPKGKLPVFVGGKPIPAPRSAASRQGSLTSSTPLNCPSTSDVHVTKQVATSENVAQYMQNVTSSDGRGVDIIVEEMMNKFVSIITVVELWTERCLTVVKAVKDRALYGAFLSSLNRCHKGALKQELRKVSMAAFMKAVHQKLHEDLSIFKYWAAMIWSDSVREVLDEDLLNEALHYLLENDSAAVRVYLRDVSKQLQASSSSSRLPSDESTNFVRYRPLHVIHRHNPHRTRDYELGVVNFPDVRNVNLEINVFCALLTGAPRKEALFDSLRSSPYLDSPLIAPEVLSAILHAELCSNTTAYLEDNLCLLTLVSDGRERETRELLLVAEQYATLKDSPAEATRPLCAGARVMAKLNDGIISDETRLQAQNYFAARDDCAHHYIGAPALGELQPRHMSTHNNNKGNNNENANSVVRRPVVQRR